MKQDRKTFISQLGIGLTTLGLPEFANSTGNLTRIDLNDFDGGAAEDEKYWNQIAKKYYDISKDYLNLENGYYGIQSKPVLESFIRNVNFVNKDAIRFARKTYPELSNKVKKELAEFLGVSDEEIIITRNATEALNIAIQGYPFKKGDEIVVNQLDYFSMVETFEMLEQRGKVKIVSFEMPLLPSSDEQIVEIYRSLINRNTRVLLLTHVSNINGLIVPVSKISIMAKTYGVDVICDSAHALGQVNYSLSDLGVDFVGMNLHKWIGNPIGAGVLYVRKNRIPELKSLFGDVSNTNEDINKLSHFGTTPFAVVMTIPDSLAFHKLMDIEKVTTRLHYLKSRWLSALKDHPGFEIVTPGDKNHSCAIASFRVPNRKSFEIANELMQRFNILTTSRVLGANGCIRVTPSLFTSAGDVDKFIDAVKAIV